MFLVYEKNYLSYGDVDCVEETDMKLYDTKEKAITIDNKIFDLYKLNDNERIEIGYVEIQYDGFKR